MSDRTALLINCSQEELCHVRDFAELEHRTLSGYVLNIVMRAVAFEEKLFTSLPKLHEANPLLGWQLARPAGRRTTMLLRCSTAEATRIRAAAKRRRVTISGFVLHALRRSWMISKGLSKSQGLPFPTMSVPVSGSYSEEAE
jgi:uncharacterized protein (DUF1778 family)